MWRIFLEQFRRSLGKFQKLHTLFQIVAICRLMTLYLVRGPIKLELLLTRHPVIKVRIRPAIEFVDIHFVDAPS